MDTPEVKIRRRTKKEAAPETAPAEAPEAPAAAETPVVLAPPPPAPAPKKATGPNLGGLLEGAQFHNGVAFGPVMTVTGINVAHVKKRMNLDVELRLVGPGVYVKIKGHAWVVPFANVVSVDLGEAGDA